MARVSPQMDALAPPPEPRALWGEWVGPFLLVALYLLFAWPTLGSLARVYLSDGNYSHGFLVPLVSLYAVWQARERLAATGAAARTRWPGLLLLLVGAVLAWLGHWYETALMPGGTGSVFLTGAGLLLCLAGLSVTLLGTQALPVLWLPLVFLCFALPLPDSVTAGLTLPLQRLVADGTAQLLRLCGVPVYQEGNVLQLATGAVGVNEACSGIRSSWVLLAAAGAMALLRCSRWRALVLVALVPFLAMGGNLVRMLVTALLVNAGHPELGTGVWHETLGLVLFMGSFAVLFFLSGWLRDPDVDAGGGAPGAVGTGPAPLASPVAAARSGSMAWGVVAGVVLAAGAGLNFFVDYHYRARAEVEFLAVRDRLPLAQFPVVIGGYRRVGVHTLTAEELREMQPSDYLSWSYAGPAGERYVVTLTYWDPQRIRSQAGLRHPHWADTCYPSQGWTAVPEQNRELEVAWAPEQVISLRSFTKDNERVVLAAWRDRAEVRRVFVPAGLAERARALWRSWDARSALVPTQFGVAVLTTLPATEARPEAGQRRVLEFAARLAPHLAAYGLVRTELPVRAE